MQASLERLRRRREDPENEGGFTLIELLIVIVILGILAAIVVFAVQNLSGQSSQASCGSDYKTVETAVEGFKAQLGVYPQTGAYAGWTCADTTSAAPQPSLTDGATAGDTQLDDALTRTEHQTVGPWLKDWPVNAGHYSIGVDAPATAGDGTVTVYASGTLAPPGSAGAAAVN